MRIGLMVNDIATEQAAYTTMRLAMRAVNSGHEAWVIGAGDFIYDTDEKKIWIKRVEYDVESAIRAIESNQLPRILGERLRLGK